MVSIAAHVIVYSLDQSVLEEDIVYDFPQFEPDVYKYLPLIPKAHSTPHDRMQELVHAIEGFDLDIIQDVVGKDILKHELELVKQNPIRSNTMIKKNLNTTFPIWIKKVCYRLVK